MTHARQIILLTILVITPTLNFKNPNYKIKSTVSSDKSVTTQKTFKRLKPFIWHRDFLWRSLDHLKQWKRRRRTFNLSRIICETDCVRLKRRSIESDSEVVSSYFTRPTVGLPGSSRPVELWLSYGMFSEDYLLSINTHWLRFPPPDPAAQYALGGLYIVIMAVGCTGNALVLLMYFRCRTLRTPGNILVANLAFSDFLMLAKTPVFIFNSFNQGPAMGKTGCVIYGFLGGLTGCTSIATLSAIAMDRYWAVVRPLEPLRSLTVIRARIMAVGTWIYAGVFSIIPALDIGYGHYVPEGYLTSCSFDYLTDEELPRYFIFVFFCAAWLAPFCTIAFCYLSIFKVVVCSRNLNTKNPENRLSSRHIKEQVKRKAEVKLALLVIAVIALFFISWTPYAVVALLGIFGRKDLITPTSSMIPALFCKTTACINPFIYIITHPMFRKEFKKMLNKDKNRRMSTMKTIGYSEATKLRQPSRDLSDSDVEVVEMKDIPHQNEKPAKLDTVSSKVTHQEGFQRSISMKSFEEHVVSPPSWYTKPQFSKKKSFHRRSTKSVSSSNTDVII